MTDGIRWKKVASHEPNNKWLTRAELIAHLIRPGDVVCDLGAGAQTLRRFLPSSVGYIPVDCVNVHPDTCIVDFNTDFTLPDASFNVIVCLGLLAHLNDPSHFMGELVRHQAGKFIIFDVDVHKRAAEVGQSRRFHSYDELVQFFSAYVRDMTLYVRIRNRCFLCGVIGSSNATVMAKRRPVDAIISEITPPLKYLWYRIAPR